MRDADVMEFGGFLAGFTAMEAGNPNRVTRYLVLHDVHETFWFARHNPDALRMDELPA